ncbi:MAG: MarR family transcriptional regulator [Thermoleophilaceae bacterium]|nr:MarR family transcriptional regulator [Thermoleophilaceae bacterium]
MQQAAVKPENAELVRNLGSLVVHIMKTCSRGMLEAVDRLGLSLSQLKALQALATADGLEMSLKEMGDALGLSLPAISRAVDGLVQRELVTRTEDPNDRRSKRVAATAAGRALLDELTVLRLADLEAFVETLSPRERRQLEQAVTSIVTARALPPLSPRKE